MAFIPDLKAQKEAEIFTSRHSAFLEVGGNGILFSLNYEHIFWQKGKLKTAARVGITPLLFIDFNEKLYIGPPFIPTEVVGFLGRKNHHFEFGAGYTPFWLPASKDKFSSETDPYQYGYFLPFRLGYRFQRPEKGDYFYRVGYTPVFISIKDKFLFEPLFCGISIGKNF